MEDLAYDLEAALQGFSSKDTPFSAQVQAALPGLRVWFRRIVGRRLSTIEDGKNEGDLSRRVG